MKKIITAVFAAVAFLTIASCQKMELANNDNESEKIVRTITGSFSNDEAKTTLGTDGKTPKWSEGDVIRVLNNSSYQDIALTSGNIKEDGKKIEFTTSLSGMLYAVYPAGATTMTECTDGNITYSIPAVQDGTFGSANICVASGDGATGKSIYFSNAIAIVEMSVAEDVVGTKFEAANNIAGNITVAMGNKGVMGTTTPSLSSNTVSVSDTKAPTGNKFYLAVAAGETGAVTITCNTLSKSGSANRSTKTLALNKIYAMNLASMTIGTDFDLTGQHGVLNGQEYVLIKAKYDGKNDSYLKWATQNLAVTASGKAKWKSTNYIIGDYFQWAASYDGYGLDGTSGKEQVFTNLVIYDSFTNTCAGGASNEFTFKDIKTFGEPSSPYNNGNNYTKYTGTSGDGKTTLEQSDDVANIVLGGTWRMPTGGDGGELEALYSATKWTWDSSDKGSYVTKSGIDLATDKSNALLFFPAAGFGYDSSIIYSGVSGAYSSSTLYHIDPQIIEMAHFMGVSQYGITPTPTGSRGSGFSVRPVSD